MSMYGGYLRGLTLAEEANRRDSAARAEQARWDAERQMKLSQDAVHQQQWMAEQARANRAIGVQEAQLQHSLAQADFSRGLQLEDQQIQRAQEQRNKAEADRLAQQREMGDFVMDVFNNVPPDKVRKPKNIPVARWERTPDGGIKMYGADNSEVGNLSRDIAHGLIKQGYGIDMSGKTGDRMAMARWRQVQTEEGRLWGIITSADAPPEAKKYAMERLKQLEPVRRQTAKAAGVELPETSQPKADTGAQTGATTPATGQATTDERGQVKRWYDAYQERLINFFGPPASAPPPVFQVQGAPPALPAATNAPPAAATAPVAPAPSAPAAPSAPQGLDLTPPPLAPVPRMSSSYSDAAADGGSAPAAPPVALDPSNTRGAGTWYSADAGAEARSKAATPQQFILLEPSLVASADTNKDKQISTKEADAYLEYAIKYARLPPERQKTVGLSAKDHELLMAFANQYKAVAKERAKTAVPR